MLELRPACENCNRLLPADSTDAMICSYECTFCTDCVSNVLHNVCPNCGGGFVPRPVRPAARLVKDFPSTKQVYKPVDTTRFAALLEKYRHIAPEKR